MNPVNSLQAIQEIITTGEERDKEKKRGGPSSHMRNEID